MIFYSFILPGLDPGIFFVASAKDCRVKPGNDEVGVGSSRAGMCGRGNDLHMFFYSFIMPGLDPGIFFPLHEAMASGFCYIMTNRPHGVLYVGVTQNLARRVYEHRMGLLDGFTSKYGLTRLVHYEEYPLFMDAVRREKAIKKWPRAWKIALVEKANPAWADLHDLLA